MSLKKLRKYLQSVLIAAILGSFAGGAYASGGAPRAPFRSVPGSISYKSDLMGPPAPASSGDLFGDPSPRDVRQPAIDADAAQHRILNHQFSRLQQTYRGLRGALEKQDKILDCEYGMQTLEWYEVSLWFHPADDMTPDCRRSMEAFLAGAQAPEPDRSRYPSIPRKIEVTKQLIQIAQQLIQERKTKGAYDWSASSDWEMDPNLKLPVSNEE